MNQDQKEVVAEGIGRILGQIGMYKLLRKMGAPVYVAYLGCIVSAQLKDITDPYKLKVDKAFTKSHARH